MSVLVKQTRYDPFVGLGREGFIGRLQLMLRDRVVAAYLFGSVARGVADPRDVDLILVTDTTLSFTRRWEMFEDVVDLTHALDLLIYTPEEFEKLTSNPSGFWVSVVQDLKQIV